MNRCSKSCGVVAHGDTFTTSTRGNTSTPVEPGSDKIASGPKAAATDNVSIAERELYGSRLRYDQSYVRHEGPLTRPKFGHMAGALP